MFNTKQQHTMKIFILTCINENSELVYAVAHRTLSEAQSKMREHARVESEEFADLGRPGNYCNVSEMSSACGDEEACYVWDITEQEL